jgi:hypothetical protein
LLVSFSSRCFSQLPFSRGNLARAFFELRTSLAVITQALTLYVSLFCQMIPSLLWLAFRSSLSKCGAFCHRYISLGCRVPFPI